MPCASALTLATKMSRPPSASPASPIQLRNAGEIGDIDRAAGRLDAVRFRAARRSGRPPRDGARRSRHRQPSAASSVGDGPADAAGAAGDDRLLSLQSEIHPSRRSLASVPTRGAMRPDALAPEKPALSGAPPCTLRWIHYAGPPQANNSGLNDLGRSGSRIAAKRCASIDGSAGDGGAARALHAGDGDRLPAERRAGQCWPAPISAGSGWSGFVISAVRWLEMLAVGVFVYQHTGSAFDVALMTLLRMLPMALFGAVIGALAERVERRKALIGGRAADAGDLAVPGRAGLCRHSGGLASGARQLLQRGRLGDRQPGAAGHDRRGRRVTNTWDRRCRSMSAATTPAACWVRRSAARCSPDAGISGAFTASVLLLCGRAGRRDRGPASQHPGRRAGRQRAGAHHRGVRAGAARPRLIGTLLVTVIYNVFGWPFTAMIPVIGQDNLHLGASAIGVLASMDGIGAFIGVVAIAVYARPAHYAAALYRRRGYCTW